jgi:hypothetical protein
MAERNLGRIATAFGELRLHALLPLTSNLVLLTMPRITRRRLGLTEVGGSITAAVEPSSLGQKDEPKGQRRESGCRMGDCCGGGDWCDCCDGCNGCEGAGGDSSCCDCHGCDCHGCDGCDCSCH